MREARPPTPEPPPIPTPKIFKDGNTLVQMTEGGSAGNAANPNMIKVTVKDLMYVMEDIWVGRDAPVQELVELYRKKARIDKASAARLQFRLLRRGREFCAKDSGDVLLSQVCMLRLDLRLDKG